jgi:anhydro-N-acetylmuramic acid kinase
MPLNDFYANWNACLSAALNGDPAASLQRPTTVLGMMSGTSLDGVDVVAAQFWVEPAATPLATPTVRFGQVELLSVAMPWPLKQTLLNVQAQGELSLSALVQLHRDLGLLFAQVASQALESFNLSPEAVLGIACHGQTLWHSPPKGRFHGGSLQLGDPALVAAQTGCPVIAQFRQGDMAVGGQGAPLVPFADALLFQHATQAQALQNIGGIANVTWVPPASQPELNPIAFDTGPGNMLLDAATSHLFGLPYDKYGGIAAMGQVHQPLLTLLQADPFIALSPPKSTGREHYGQAFIQPLLANYKALSNEDILATLTEFTAWSIADAYQRFLPQGLGQVVVSGGGTANTTLMHALERQLALHWGDAPAPTVVTSQALGIPPAAKEALAFALLGWARLHGLPNNVPSCTGAKRMVSCGSVTL